MKFSKPATQNRSIEDVYSYNMVLSPGTNLRNLREVGWKFCYRVTAFPICGSFPGGTEVSEVKSVQVGGCL